MNRNYSYNKWASRKFIDIAWGLLKWGTILENKSPLNSKIAKHSFCKSWSSS